MTEIQLKRKQIEELKYEILVIESEDPIRKEKEMFWKERFNKILQ